MTWHAGVVNVRATLAAAALAVTVAGCGTDTEPAPDVTPVPRCDDVLRDGAPAPILVNGCRTSTGALAVPAGWTCTDGRTLRGADGHWWYAGDTVHDGLPPDAVVSECLGTL